MATVPQVMSTVSPATQLVGEFIDAVGEWTEFALHSLSGLFSKRVVPGSLIDIFYSIGVMSVPVVAITGVFIGMVLAVQCYGQYHNIGLDTWIGSMIHQSVIRELGPVLAATMLAGRVGSAMAA